VEDRGTVHLVRLDAMGHAAPDPVAPSRRWVLSYDAQLTGHGLLTAFVAAEVDHPGRLVVRVDEAEHVVVDTAVGYLATAAPVSWEHFTAPCADGSNEIDAWIVRPPGAEPGRRYPVLLNVHGGPHTQYGETFFDEAQVQAAAGYVVVMSNPRGSSGREQAWGQAILGPKHHTNPGTGWGGADVDDVMAVLDAALARFDCCDPERVGMLGGSYGGWMATELAGRFGHRFRAFCSERAVNNLVSEEWSSDVATSFWTEIGPTHLEDPHEYVRMSPVRRAAEIDRPMLLIHSEEDWRCPIGQAEELFVALRLLGKDVTFYRFPGEGHELSRSGSPVHRVQRFEIILDFFAQHLSSGGT
jgi:dipeptidyl aminopeptidase/acylaminoacyl peptidase